MPETKTYAAATEFLMQHRQHLTRRDALDHCTEHLVEQLEVSRNNASLIALQALADIECAGQSAWIDTQATTSHVVVIRDPDGRSIACTVKDLLRMHALGSTSAPNVH